MSIHTFAICAYKESPYLSECVESVLNQEYSQSEVYISTSTPNSSIDAVAKKYQLPVYINEGTHGIGPDWNFAYSKASSDFITIAHQDDIYLPGYAKAAVDQLSSRNDSLIFFSNYGEIRNGRAVDDNRNLKIKRSLLSGLANSKNANSIRIRRRALSFGNPICCPAVTFNRANCPNPPFLTDMKSNIDWGTWEKLSSLQGSFCYDENILMRHRIHEESTTSSLIGDNTRYYEDLEMLERFWPRPIAKIINHFYKQGENSNSI
ncbi:MAG: glycosyltransferase [Atopobiaceae bacterium]